MELTEDCAGQHGVWMHWKLYVFSCTSWNRPNYPCH